MRPRNAAKEFVDTVRIPRGVLAPHPLLQRQRRSGRFRPLLCAPTVLSGSTNRRAGRVPAVELVRRGHFVSRGEGGCSRPIRVYATAHAVTFPVPRLPQHGATSRTYDAERHDGLLRSACVRHVERAELRLTQHRRLPPQCSVGASVLRASSFVRQRAIAL
jgi:hypothetical protein